MNATDLAVDALAAYRLTRLAVHDTIADRPRFALQRRSPFLDELLGCPHCTGVWAAGAVCAARALAPRWWPRLARPLAIAGAVSVVSQLMESRGDE